MRRISAWISLEPEAGTRKINNYPTTTNNIASPSSQKIPEPTASVNTGVASEISGNSPGASSSIVEVLASKTGKLTREEIDTGKGAEGVALQEGRGEKLEGVSFGGNGEHEENGVDLDREEKQIGVSIPTDSQVPTATVDDRSSHDDRDGRVDDSDGGEGGAHLSAGGGEDDGPDRSTHDDRNGRDHDSDGGGRGAHLSAGGVLFPALSAVEKARAARECKRLLDHGRKAFLEDRLGLRSEVVHFVEKEVTPENALLLAFR